MSKAAVKKLVCAVCAFPSTPYIYSYLLQLKRTKTSSINSSFYLGWTRNYVCMLAHFTSPSVFEQHPRSTKLNFLINAICNGIVKWSKARMIWHCCRRGVSTFQKKNCQDVFTSFHSSELLLKFRMKTEIYDSYTNYAKNAF